ncbi:MAG: methylmalonyl-CoA mutase family protein, partial [Bacteroidota bacterium]
KIEKDLKGKSLESLDWEISDDWTVSPLAHSSDWSTKEHAIIKAGKTNNSWEIGEVIQVKDVKTANQEALLALEGGVGALLFELSQEFAKEDFKTLLKNIQLEWISTHFHVKGKLPITVFLSYLEASDFNTQKIKGSWRSENIDIEQLSNLPLFKCYPIDGSTHYKGTAQTIDELTHTLLTANDILKTIEATQVHRFFASIAIGESYFINIAKIRALKILWHNLMKAYQLETPLQLEAHLAISSLAEDQHQNMIQMSTQALSAVIGGVDRLFLTPAANSNTAFTKRIARNVQHLLQLESHLDHVIDPSAGSYYIEKLTWDMTNRSWEQFKKMVA